MCAHKKKHNRTADVHSTQKIYGPRALGKRRLFKRSNVQPVSAHLGFFRSVNVNIALEKRELNEKSVPYVTNHLLCF